MHNFFPTLLFQKGNNDPSYQHDLATNSGEDSLHSDTKDDQPPKYTSSSYSSIPEKQPTQWKVGRRPKQAFLQRRHRGDGQEAHEKMLNMTLEKCKSKPQRGAYLHLTAVRMPIIRKSTKNKCWRGCGEKGTLLLCWWKCKLIQPLFDKSTESFKTLTIKITIWPSNPTTEHLPWENHNS